VLTGLLLPKVILLHVLPLSLVYLALFAVKPVPKTYKNALPPYVILADPLVAGTALLVHATPSFVDTATTFEFKSALIAIKTPLP